MFSVWYNILAPALLLLLYLSGHLRTFISSKCRKTFKSYERFETKKTWTGTPGHLCLPSTPLDWYYTATFSRRNTHKTTHWDSQLTRKDTFNFSRHQQPVFSIPLCYPCDISRTCFLAVPLPFVPVFFVSLLPRNAGKHQVEGTKWNNQDTTLTLGHSCLPSTPGL